MLVEAGLVHKWAVRWENHPYRLTDLCYYSPMENLELQLPPTS